MVLEFQKVLQFVWYREQRSQLKHPLMLVVSEYLEALDQPRLVVVEVVDALPLRYPAEAEAEFETLLRDPAEEEG